MIHKTWTQAVNKTKVVEKIVIVEISISLMHRSCRRKNESNFFLVVMVTPLNGKSSNEVISQLPSMKWENPLEWKHNKKIARKNIPA
jgi:hypothetical protein